MPPLNPPPSRHAGASDAKIHKLAYGFGQYEFWPRPTLACRAADNAETHHPTDCNIRAGISAKSHCRDATCSVSGNGATAVPAKGLRATLVLPFFLQQNKGRKECHR